jgi:hypothetical protein
MKKYNFNKTIYFFALIMGLSLAYSCSKTDTPINNTTDTGSLTIEFENIANGESLTFDKEYTNAAGEKMKFSRFDYYISNIVLWKTDGTSYTVPRDSSYFLIKDNGTINSEITLNNIPVGDYNKFSFVIGVDSLKNTEPASARVGDLNTGNGMYWSWNSGYIFLKAEGSYNSDTTKKFKYHIGLFGVGSGTSSGVNNLKTITLASSSEKAMVSKTIKPNLHLLVDVMEMFKTPNAISVATKPVIMVDPASKNIADNYVDMFKIDHIHN